jgi:hypothetical protein
VTLLRGHFPLRRRFTLSLEKKNVGEENPMNDQLLWAVLYDLRIRVIPAETDGEGQQRRTREERMSSINFVDCVCPLFFFLFNQRPHTHTERESSSCSNRTLPIFFLCPFFLERFRVKKKTKLTLSDCFDSPPSSSIGYTRERQMKDVTVFNAVRWTFEPRFL